MNNDKWIEHLSHWRAFLDARLSSVEDEGDREKITRQMTAIERVRYSAVLNPQLLIEFINPIAHSLSCETGETEYHLELNSSQRKAVNTAIKGDGCLSLIQGPPGTGKTQVIAEICIQVCRRNPNAKILVCSETHVAVNNLLSRIAEYDPSIRCMRIRDKEQNSDVDAFSPRAVMSAYQKWLEETCDDQDLVDLITEMMPEYENRGLEKALALSANVVGMTCNRIGAYRFLDTTEMFDYAIIDEVCKATLPEILMPITISKRAVLVGDPKQLPPIFCSEDRETIRGIENCDLQKYMYIDELFLQSKDTMILDTQYRMEKTIGTLISNLFYDGMLKNGRDAEKHNSLAWIDYTPAHEWPDTDEENDDKPIIRNLDECRIIKNLLDKMDKETAEKRDIAIIVPYRHQVFELKKIINGYHHLKTAVDTVDGFQGKEADIVIFGITRTTGPFRFLADERRMNVALSRAKDQIIIIGYKTYAEKHQLLKRIIDSCEIEKYDV